MGSPFDEYNDAVKAAYAKLRDSGALAEEMPVGCVQWLPIEQVMANDYNPNSVAGNEMRLLHTSISEDGYTQPVVAVWDDENQKAVIVDGFHRYTVMRRYADIAARAKSHLPVVILNKPMSDRIASTVRHNRARGKHSVSGMGNLVFQMLTEGESEQTICEKLGLEAEELARLKHITGYSKLFANVEGYSRSTLVKAQMKAKADYRQENPDEHIPDF